MPTSCSNASSGVGNLRKEVLDFIVVCERIHGVLAQGDRLSDDERAIVVMSASDLMSKLKPA